jgi:NADPH-dependent 2,4-dienoyl-CoA reductase/sulfur reductase-like enzyme
MIQDEPVRVVAIGSGFAGLAIADRLVTLGHDVTSGQDWMLR